MIRKGILVVVALVLSAASAFAQGTHQVSHSPVKQLIGAFSSPPAGPGPGIIVDWSVGSSAVKEGHFGQAGNPTGNSFYVAYDAAKQLVYVPTVAGTTYVVNARTLQPAGQFPSLPGERVARLVPGGKTVLVLSGKQLAAYSTATHKQLFRTNVGGNAIVLTVHGRRAFVGGNMDSTITEVALSNGAVVGRFPVAHSGDLALALGELFSGDMKSGVMSVLDLKTGKVTRISTSEVDPHFSYRRIGAAKAGFMQLAVSPDNKVVYAAGFSGHILKFSTTSPAYLGEVAVSANPGGLNKLSGLALIDKGREAVVTVENLKEAVVVNLSSGKILRTLKGTSSNRWVAVR